MALPDDNVTYRSARAERPAIGQSSEVFAESLESIPFQTGAAMATWPPESSFAASSDDAVSSDTYLHANLPRPYDLAWLQGDVMEAQWVFEGEFLMPTDPEISDPLAPEWVEAEWKSQIRSAYLYSSLVSDYWVPYNGFQYSWWRGHSQLAELTVTAEAFQVPTTGNWGTLVTVTLNEDDSRLILPSSSYRWSLQSRETDAARVRTRLQGHARALTDWTF